MPSTRTAPWAARPLDSSSRRSHTGRCVIADALYIQRESARQTLDCGPHCILTVKGNHTAGATARRLPVVERSEGRLGDRRIERRTSQVSLEQDLDSPWLAFLGVRLVARVKREVIDKKIGQPRSTHSV